MRNPLGELNSARSLAAEPSAIRGAIDNLSPARATAVAQTSPVGAAQRTNLYSECFVAGTLVQTSTGPRSIEDIRVGDMVAARDQLSKQTGLRQVKQLFIIEDKEIVHLTFRSANGELERVSATKEHPFFVHGNWWKGASDLVPGDLVDLLEGGVAEVVSSEIDAERANAYNFEVEDFHTYFVGRLGVWVHNSSSINWVDVKNAAGASSATLSALKHGEFTAIRFGDNGAVYAKLPAPSNPEVMRWQRMNGEGISNRDAFMGNTPSRDSTVGLRVQHAMRQSGALTGQGTNRLVLGSDGNWHPIAQTDMGHVRAAVDFWNSEGRYYGPRAPEVRNFMTDSSNYWLEPSSINRSNGASMGRTYMQPATQIEKNQFFSISEIE